MPLFKKIHIKPVNKLGARGTKQASEMLEMFRENWEQIQEKFNAFSEEERNDMLDHFNRSFENLGDALFGKDACIDELENYVESLNEERKGEFCTCVNDALLYDE